MLIDNNRAAASPPPTGPHHQATTARCTPAPDSTCAILMVALESQLANAESVDELATMMANCETRHMLVRIFNDSATKCTQWNASVLAAAVLAFAQPIEPEMARRVAFQLYRSRVAPVHFCNAAAADSSWLSDEQRALVSNHEVLKCVHMAIDPSFRQAFRPQLNSVLKSIADALPSTNTRLLYRMAPVKRSAHAPAQQRQHDAAPDSESIQCESVDSLSDAAAAAATAVAAPSNTPKRGASNSSSAPKRVRFEPKKASASDDDADVADESAEAFDVLPKKLVRPVQPATAKTARRV